MKNSIYWFISALFLIISLSVKAQTNYRLTPNVCPETSVLNEIHIRFGSSASLADWDSIKIKFGADLDNFYNSIGLKDSGCAIVQCGGQEFYNSTIRHYYIQRCDGGLPYPSFLAHDQVGCLYLGSWYDLNMNILAKTINDNEKFRLTPDLHSETENLPLVIHNLFGNTSILANWDQIKIKYGNNLSSFYLAIGLKDSGCAIVQVSGQEFYNGSNRHFYIQRCDAGLPYPSFLAHDQIGSLYLGSWYGLNMNLLADSTLIPIPFVQGISTDNNQKPSYFNLEQNYPNPFNPNTIISFHVPHMMNVKISIYDLKGMLIRELINESKSRGSYSIEWNGKDKNNNSVSSGTYFYQLNTGELNQTKKMILLK
ncbi:MAG: T9SS type A sorting domain-containing protein [Ignavibacteriaceae bacterium]|nr:T9SS type A sorting domain-containing protein [Ignavibacteriaceae bacterium]